MVYRRLAQYDQLVQSTERGHLQFGFRLLGGGNIRRFSDRHPNRTLGWICLECCPVPQWRFFAQYSQRCWVRDGISVLGRRLYRNGRNHHRRHLFNAARAMGWEIMDDHFATECAISNTKLAQWCKLSFIFPMLGGRQLSGFVNHDVPRADLKVERQFVVCSRFNRSKRNELPNRCQLHIRIRLLGGWIRRRGFTIPDVFRTLERRNLERRTGDKRFYVSSIPVECQLRHALRMLGGRLSKSR